MPRSGALDKQGRKASPEDQIILGLLARGPRIWLSVWSWFSSLRRLPPSVPQVVLSTNHTRAGVPDCEDAVYDPALLGRRFRLPTNVRLWLQADLRLGRDLRPLYPRKQTYRGPMSAPGAIADHLQSDDRRPLVTQAV